MNAVYHLLRLFAALLTLGFTSSTALASGWNLRADSTSNPRREMLWGLPRDDPAIAMGAIVLAALIVLAVAWVASRVGDKS